MQRRIALALSVPHIKFMPIRQNKRGAITGCHLKFGGKRLENVLNRMPKEYAGIIRQIWNEGRERTTKSVRDARRMDKENGKVRSRQ